MPDPPPAAAANYPTAPPPPGASPPGTYPAPPYGNWQGASAPQYRGPMMPAWLSFGGVLIVVGGLLVLIGFLVEVIANATFAGATVPNYQNYYNQMAVFDALVGVGIFLAFLGWLFHQMSRHRQMSQMMGH